MPCASLRVTAPRVYRTVVRSFVSTLMSKSEMNGLPVASIRMFPGLMSLWRKCREWMNSMRYSIWSASISTVFRVNLRLQ